MSAVGLCVNVTGELPSATELLELGISGGWIRTPVQGDIALLENLARLPPSVNVCVTLNNECTQVGGDWGGWEDALWRIRRDYSGRVQAVACGNELDLFPDTPADFAADLVRRAMPILRPAGILTLATSVTSGDWPGYLARLCDSCGDAQPDYYDFHGYGKGFDGLDQQPFFGRLDDAIYTARTLVGGRLVAMTEGGVKIGEVGGESGQAEYVRRWVELVRSLPAEVCPFATYFALSDRTGAPSEQGDSAFGLRDPDGRARPAWRAFAMAAGGSGVVVPVKPKPKPVPPEVVVADSFNVGAGMRSLMKKRGDVPSADELYFKGADGKDEWSECMTVSGRLYRYVFSNGKTFSYAPEAA